MDSTTETVEQAGDRHIDQGDLTDLQQITVKRNQILSELGNYAASEYELKKAKEQKFEELELVNREQTFTYARVMRKYGLPENTRIDLSTGAIVE